MKKAFSALLALMLLSGVLALGPALAEDTAAEPVAAQDLIVSAQVIAKIETALKAPASGELEPFTLRAGDAVKKGETLFTIEPVSVYADISGTIAAVYAKAGDIADAAVSRFGSVLAIEHQDRYQIEANTMTGYSSAQNRNLYVGTPVYLRSVNEKHFAQGIITEVNGRAYTVSVIGGDLVFTENVKIYRDPDYDNKALLGRASLSSIAPYTVTASGTIVAMNVKAGDSVAAGDLLFTYVPDSLDPDRRGTSAPTAVQADADWIVSEISVTQGSSVQKGQALCTVYPAGEYQLVASVDEGDIAGLAPGDTMTAVFEELNLAPIPVTIASVSPLGTDEETSRYRVYFDFDAPEGVLLGMHATVQR